VASLASLQVTPGSRLVVSGNATLDLAGPEASSLDGLGVYGGTLSGAGTRTVTGSAVLDAGTLSGNGRTVVGPGAELRVGTGQGGAVVINGGHVLALDAGATGTWGPGPHDITLDAPSRIEVAGALDIANDRTLGGSGTLAVTGTLRKLSHGTTTLRLADPAASLLVLAGTIEVRAGLLDISGPGLDVEGTLQIEASRFEVGAVRTTTLELPATGSLRLGIAGTAPAARVGSVTVTGTPPDLAGSVVLDPDADFAAPVPQRLVLVATTAAPTGRPTVSDVTTLPNGTVGSVTSEPNGLILEVGPAR